MLLIKNGRVIDPVTHTDEVMDVLIDGNHIVKTGYDLEAEGAEVIDADGLVVAPGLVDTHVHFRDPGFTYKEDIETGAAAAARGGFTMVVCMANTKPAVDNLETLKYIQDKGAKTGIHVVQTATVTKGLAGKNSWTWTVLRLLVQQDLPMTESQSWMRSFFLRLWIRQGILIFR